MDPTAPIPAPPSLTDLYVKARTAGLSDTDAALAVAQHLREQADVRSTFREAGALAAGRPYDAVGERAQLMGEADRPLQDLAARRATAPLAMEEAKRRGELASADIGAQQAAQQRDPNHPTNVALRAALAKAGVAAPPGLTVATMPKELYETVKPLAELTGKQSEITAQAPGRAAEAAKARAEAGRTTALTGPEAAKTTAEAGKAEAEAGHTRMLTSGQVAPGYSRGSIPIDEAEATKINDQYKGHIEAKNAVDEILKLAGSKDFISNPQTRAKLQPRIANLVAQLRGSTGIRQLAGPELEFAKQIINDPTAINPSNIAGWANNRTRFKELSRILDESWAATVKAKDLRQDGGGGATAVNVSPASKETITGKSGKKYEWIEGKGWMPAAGAAPAAIASVGP